MVEDQISQAQEPDAVTDIKTLWMVCFSGRVEKLYWWDRLLLTDRFFRHCYVVQYQLDVDHWVLLDWRTGICDVVVITHDEISYLLNQLKAAKGTIVLYKAKLPDKDFMIRIPIMYCVSAVLQVLGIRAGWTFTPKQLYKRLIKAGGNELVNYRSA